MSADPADGRGLALRLEARRPEIERVTLARVYGVSDPTAVEDPEYLSGLKAAVSAALSYGIARIGCEDEDPVPSTLLAQARHAARSGVGLDTVLRRYVAGHSLLNNFVVAEAERGEARDGEALPTTLRAQAMLLDRLLARVSREYTLELDERHRDSDQRRVDRVKMLLEGQLIEPHELNYDLDGWHIGVIAAGPEVASAVRHLAAGLDRSLLVVRLDRETIWAWLGGRRLLSAGEAIGLAKLSWPNARSLSLGEPGQGIDGWRLTHRQAKAAAPIAARGPQCVVRYTDVALLAAALRDDVLAGSLRETYLAPLMKERDGGKALRATLRAYFETGRNASSAAAALGVSRQTVNGRLRKVEEQLERGIDECGPELETALRLRAFDLPPAGRSTS